MGRKSGVTAESVLTGRVKGCHSQSWEQTRRTCGKQHKAKKHSHEHFSLTMKTVHTYIQPHRPAPQSLMLTGETGTVSTHTHPAHTAHELTVRCASASCLSPCSLFSLSVSMAFFCSSNSSKAKDSCCSFSWVSFKYSDRLFSCANNN